VFERLQLQYIRELGTGWFGKVTVLDLFYNLYQGGNVFARLCSSVCLCVSKITQKVIDGSFGNFEGLSGMAQTTSDSILGMIQKKSWILDHFEIFITIAFNGA